METTPKKDIKNKDLKLSDKPKKWVNDFEKLPENIQDNLTHLSENLKRKKSVSQLTKEFIEILQTNKLVRKTDEKVKFGVALVVLLKRYTPKQEDYTDDEKTHNLEETATRNFKDQNLMFLIKRELDKDHVGDSKGKMAAFLVGCSSKQRAKYRISMALRGDSSVGKTNLMKTVLRHLPKHWYAFGTRFTRATLEDDVVDFGFVVFSEKTQNADVTQTLKQLTEDGLQTWKHDKETNKLIDPKFIPRKSTLYSSTENETNEELATRYVVYNVSKSKYKIRNVIEKIKETYSDFELQMEEERREKKPTWITVGLEQLESFDVILIPLSFVKYIEFNNLYPRCARDSKRFLNYIAVSAWLHQWQRTQYEKHGKKILSADLDDFYWAALFTSIMFKESISDISKDTENLIKVYESMLENGKEVTFTEPDGETTINKELLRYVRRRELARESYMNIKTLKEHLKPLREKGRLRTRRSGFGGEICVAITPDKKDAYYFLLKHNYEKLYFALNSMDENTNSKMFNDHIKNKFEFKDVGVSFKNNTVLIDSDDDEFIKIQTLINNKNTNISAPKIKLSFSMDEFNDEKFS